jgi:membrane protease subunit (stomatin/prohibitin family)
MNALLEKLRGELVDIIECVDHSRDTLVWRFPRYRNQIKTGAQLIVRPGQMALFVHRGRLADVFEPGQYTLTTDNLPVLGSFMGWAHGFDSSFKSEVYFVNTRQVTDLKWGTPNAIILRDPEFGPIRLRAFGTYTLKVLSPTVLLNELVGTDESFDAGEIHELLRSVVHSALADLLGKAQIAALDLARNYRGLAEQVRQTVVARVGPEYGLDVPQLVIVNISLPETVEKALDARTSMNVIGDLDRFQKYQAGESLTIAAGNPSGAAATFVGMAAGAATGQAMMPGVFGASAPPPQTQDCVWHMAIGEQIHGPCTLQQVTEAVRQGKVNAATLVWRPGMSNWVKASQLKELGTIPWMPPPLPRT